MRHEPYSRDGRDARDRDPRDGGRRDEILRHGRREEPVDDRVPTPRGGRDDRQGRPGGSERGGRDERAESKDMDVAEEEGEEDPDAAAMAAMMGFGGFGTTQVSPSLRWRLPTRSPSLTLTHSR